MASIEKLQLVFIDPPVRCVDDTASLASALLRC